MIKVISLGSYKCFCCGKQFDEKNKDLRKTKHHAIPITLKPKFNIVFPLCEKCHRELNNLYANQEKKQRAPKPLKVFTNKMEGLANSYKSFGKKIEKIHNDFMLEIARIEEKDDKQ